MITTTVAELMNAQAALERLAAERLPVQTAYRVAKLLRLARPEIQQFTEQRDSLIRELGAERRTPTGDVSIEVTAENRQAFFTQVNELAQLEVQLAIEPLEIAALNGAELTAGDLIALDRFIV